MKSIYSCLFGNYDELKQAPNFSGWDSVLFTNLDLSDSKGWIIKKVDSENELKDSRKYKWLSHIFLSEYDLVCYIDCNMTLISPPPNNPIWFLHPSRAKVFEEAKRIIELKRGSLSEIDRQMRFYVETKFSDKVGLFSNGFFIRSNRNENINKLHEYTFDIVDRFSHRDQLALPYAIEQTRIRPQNIQKYQLARRFIKLDAHKKTFQESKKVFVHHITPARSDKNFGKAINQMIEHLPEDDWICLRDIDTVPTNHVSFIQQCEDIANKGEWDLIGCMTNRLGLHYQLIDGRISENTDFLHHMEIGNQLAKDHWADVKPCPASIGGIFMMFSKSLWLKVGKFPEGGIVIKGKFLDWWISDSVRKIRGKIGIAQGIYLWHTYRIGLKGKDHLF